MTSNGTASRASPDAADEMIEDTVHVFGEMRARSAGL
jgi:hypothetical protein